MRRITAKSVFSRLSMVAFLTIMPYAAQAGALACSSLFLATPLSKALSLLDQADPGHNYAEAAEKKWIRFLLRKTAKTIEPDRLSYVKDYDQVVWDFLSRTQKINFINSKGRTWQTRLGPRAWAHRQIMAEGLKSLLSEHQAVEPGALKRLQYAVQKVLSHPVIMLPLMNDQAIKDRPLPPDLLAKLLINGYEAHHTEVQAIYKRQMSVDGYRVFAQSYKLLSIIFGIWTVIDMQDNLKKQQQIDGNQDIDNLIESIERLDALLSQT